MTGSFSAPAGRKIIAQGNAQRRPGAAIPKTSPALKGRQKLCAATIRNFRMVRVGSHHLNPLFADSEIQENSVIRNFRITAARSRGSSISWLLKARALAPWRLRVLA